jgi:hypothetical protein
MTVYPYLLDYRTALFELLDAHISACNTTGLVFWIERYMYMYVYVKKFMHLFSYV